MELEDLAICPVKPTKDKKFISSLYAVQALDDSLLHYQLCFHTGGSPLMGSPMSLF
jgi:hypothetical protein